MDGVQRIGLFLRAVRRRAFLEAALRLAGLTATVLLIALVALTLAALRIGPAAFWPRLTMFVVTSFALSGAAMFLLGPVRCLRSDLRLARFVGGRQPPLRSDLLSAIELGSAAPGAGAQGSPVMMHAFFGAVAETTSAVDVRGLVPLRGAAQAGVALALVAAVIGVVAWACPAATARGLRLLTRQPTRFEGAVVSTEPLFGEARLTYTYPQYTALPARVVEGSTGDIVGLKGTHVQLDAPLLRRAQHAALLVGEHGEKGEHAAQVTDGKLHASLILHESETYSVWLSGLLGRPVREARGHRIVVEADQAPRVEIQGPADHLELETPHPIEVGYSASDDFGLAAVDLVFQVGNEPEQRQRLKDADGARHVAGRTLFEPVVGLLRPGDVVSYRIEARDRDEVSGAKIGASRTLTLTIQNPRENFDSDLQREREVKDKLLIALADRLEIAESPLPPGATPGDLATRMTAWAALHEIEEAALALLGRMVDDQRRKGGTSKNLANTLAAIADRLGKLMRDETSALAAARGKSDPGTLSPALFARLTTDSAKHVQELETSVLALDDLIGRQRLDDLAALGKDLTDAHKRLEDLLTRYAATHDEALRRQIEREIRELRARIEELAQKIAAVKARNEVPAEWQNLPDMKEVADRAKKLDHLLEKGDPQALKEALAQLGDALKSLQQGLDGNARDFADQRFSPESAARAEMMKKLGELEGDERSLAQDGQALSGELDEAASSRLKDTAEAFIARLTEKIDRLRGKLGTAPPKEISDAAEDDLGRARDSTKLLRRLLSRKEWGEGKREADRIASSVRRLRRLVEDRKSTRRASTPAFEGFDRDTSEAGALAQDVASELDKVVPRGEAMSPEQRQRGKGMGSRQDSLAKRTRDLGGEAGKNGDRVPGMDKAAADLRGIGDQIGESGTEFQRGNAREGSGKARDAADRLAQLRDAMNKERGKSGGSQRREPIRIPGADDSRAPAQWRAELLEAMRGKAPERFRDEVRKYYEDLVK